MAIMGFVIIVAGRAFSDSTGMRLRSQNMLASAEEAGRVSAIVKEDVSQMGAKSWSISSSSGNAFDTVASVYINYGDASLDATDLSSYVLTRNQPATAASSFDSIVFHKAHYDSYGICAAVLEIEWYVRADSTLVRRCKSTKPTKCNGTLDLPECTSAGFETEMASDVAEFKFLPSKRGVEGSAIVSDTLFPTTSASNSFNLAKGTPATTASSTISGTRVILSNFEQNYDSTGSSHANFYLSESNSTDCRQFTFYPGEEYAIEFELICQTNACRNTSIDENFNPMVMFMPGSDHLSVGLRSTNMNGSAIAGISDFLFYPPIDQTANKIRHFEFSVPPPNSVTACVGITAAFYSHAASGRLEFDNFRVFRKTDKVYHFDREDFIYNPESGKTKASVKAFELSLGINKKGEINRTITVIPVPNNGVLIGGDI